VQAQRDEASALPRPQRKHYYATELRNMQACLSTTISGFAAAVTAPTYVLHGSRDKMVPMAAAEQLARIIPGARFDLLEGGSHTLMGRSAEARQRVIAWIQRIEGPARHGPHPLASDRIPIAPPQFLIGF
jgi:pimeloyl-ACP methyl ester carboxylesterase